MPGITRNITKIERDGIKYWTSGAQYIPTTSASSLPQIIGVTCSADTGNNLATTSSLSGYFIIPLVSESISDGTVNSNTIVGSNLNIFYVTASIFDFSGGANTFATASGTPTFFTPTSSNTTVNFNIAVRIEKNETANNVALKTFNAITGAAALNSFVSASVSASILSIANVISGALHSPPFISASGFSFNYIQSGSFGSGSIPNYKPSLGFLSDVSSSFSIVRDSDDADSIEFSKLSLASNTRESVFYASGSGRIGFKTKDPLADVDIRADEFQIQKRTERRGLKINTEGNIESFDKNAATAATGSEFILKYSRGITITPAFLAAVGFSGPITGANNTEALTNFNNFKPDLQANSLEKGERLGFINPAEAGDTLGQIRWVSESGSIGTFDERVTGETAVIKAVVSSVASDGVQADLIFSVAGKTGGAEQKLLLDAGNQHQITGSLNVGSNITLKGFIQPSPQENSQTRIDFSNSGVDIDFYSNTTQVLTLSNTGIVFNELSNDVDLRIEGNGDANLFVTNAGTDKVGIGTNAPGEKLEVVGNISASGTITALSSDIVTINGGSF